MYRRDMLKSIKSVMISRNMPFWNDHPASDFLEEYVKSGIAKAMKPNGSGDQETSTRTLW